MLLAIPCAKVYTTETGDIIELPIVLPSSWLQVLLTDHVSLPAGGEGNNIHEQLKAFWTCYEFYQPQHEVYKKDRGQLEATLPLMLRGDEGRYLKKET